MKNFFTINQKNLIVFMQSEINDENFPLEFEKETIIILEAKAHNPQKENKKIVKPHNLDELLSKFKKNIAASEGYFNSKFVKYLFVFNGADSTAINNEKAKNLLQDDLIFEKFFLIYYYSERINDFHYKLQNEKSEQKIKKLQQNE